MRLRVMQNILDQNLSKLDFSYSGIQGSNDYEIQNFPEFAQVLEELTKFNFLEAEKERLKATGILYNKNSRVIVNADMINLLQELWM
jgi:hypothetical protein